MAGSKVCIVFSVDFGGALSDLDPSVPIWIAQSEKNDPVIVDLWKAKVGSITSFQPQGFGQLLDTVDQHHPGWGELEVYGLRADQAKIELAEYGGRTLRTNAGRFCVSPEVTARIPAGKVIARQQYRAAPGGHQKCTAVQRQP